MKIGNNFDEAQFYNYVFRFKGLMQISEKKFWKSTLTLPLGFWSSAF